MSVTTHGRAAVTPHGRNSATRSGCSRDFGEAPGSLSRGRAVDSKKLEHGFRVSWAGLPSVPSFGVGGWSYSNFLASTVPPRHPGQ